MEAIVRFKKITANGGFLFANVNGAEKILVHQGELDVDLTKVFSGDVLDVGEIVETPRGLKGLNVTWVSRPGGGELTPFEGDISTYDFARKFAFAAGPDGDVFLHIVGFEDYNGDGSATFDALTPGTRVSGYYRRTTRGLRGQHIVLA